MKNSSRAFSLVECIIALGIVSFSLVGLLGMMAGGYGGMQRSINSSTQAQIIQSLAAEIQMLDFSVLIDGKTTYRQGFPRYYDNEGQQQDSNAKANYAVTVSLNPSLVPGGIQNSDNAQQIVIKIANLCSNDASKNYCVWAINNGR